MTAIRRVWRRFKARFKAWVKGLFAKKPVPVPPPGPAPAPEPSPYRVQTVRRGKLGALAAQSAPIDLIIRIPKVGDRIWWAPKQIWGEIFRVLEETMNFTFVAGDMLVGSDGRYAPRWTVRTGMTGHYFDASVNAWIIGRGLLPKNVRGKIITPEPIKLKLNLSTGELAPRRQ